MKHKMLQIMQEKSAERVTIRLYIRFRWYLLTTWKVIVAEL